MSKKNDIKVKEVAPENQEAKDLLDILNSIDISDKTRKVIRVLGENTLVFEDDQFFLEETRNPKKRKQLSRKAAKEMLLDYAIKHKSEKKKTERIKE